MSKSKITDQDLWNQLRSVTSQFPNLDKTLPNDWPHAAHYGITCKSLRRYACRRASEFWDHLNLPLMLHNIAIQKHPKIVSLFVSILATLDDFSLNMGNLPGARGILKPMWEDAWNRQPRFWAVVSEVSLALFLVRRQNVQVVGFEQKIPSTGKRADIQGVFNGKVVWFDVEAAALKKEIRGGDGQFRAFIEKRALDKIAGKFKGLSPSEFGVIASVYRPKGRNTRRFHYQNSQTTPVPGADPNQFAHVYWLVAGTLPNQPYALHMIDHTVQTTPMNDPGIPWTLHLKIYLALKFNCFMAEVSDAHDFIIKKFKMPFQK